MAIVVSRNNYGRPLPEEEQKKMNLTDNSQVAHTLERVLMRISRENAEDAGLRTNEKKVEGALDHKIIGKSFDS